MRCRLSTTCWPEPSGVEPTDSPVLPPWGTMLTPAAAQALTTAATFWRAGRAHHGQGFAAHAFAPVLFVSAQIAFGEDMGIANNLAQRGEQSSGSHGERAAVGGRQCKKARGKQTRILSLRSAAGWKQRQSPKPEDCKGTNN